VDIKDDIATVIYRDAVARPKMYPRGVMDWVKGIKGLQKSGYDWTMDELYSKSETWKGFKASLTEHTGQLPEICTENE
jgi:hypothetical protein